MTERQYKYKFKIQVPRDIPDIAIEDKLGRKWVKASSIETDEYIQWDIDEDQWYVWFKKGLDVPEEGEIVEFSDQEYTVENVYHFNRVNRAVITFS
tara:strand:- start:39 stop:326 length:288 start_codon:yes stop_codon:yes gene_type:complete